jgi:hypothetical protein
MAGIVTSLSASLAGTVAGFLKRFMAILSGRQPLYFTGSVR